LLGTPDEKQQAGEILADVVIFEVWKSVIAL
jgi:hypothetical protein